MAIFIIEKLGEVDRMAIKKGRCPWCASKLYPGMGMAQWPFDFCSDCGDYFATQADYASNKVLLKKLER